MRFLKGLIYVAIGLLIAFNQQAINDATVKFFQNQGCGYKDAVVYMENTLLFPNLFFIGLFFYGIFLMFWNKALDSTLFTSRKAGPGSPGDKPIESYSGYGNLSKAMNYRDAIMGTCGQKKSKQIFAESAWVDGIMANNGAQKNTKKTLDYLDARLGCLGNKAGLEWLRSGAKD